MVLVGLSYDIIYSSGECSGLVGLSYDIIYSSGECSGPSGAQL